MRNVPVLQKLLKSGNATSAFFGMVFFMKVPFWSLFIFVAFFSCSTIPDFRPSKPIEEASSFEESLGLCAEYQINGKMKNESEIQLSKLVSIVPWMRCMEQPIRKFSNATNHEDLTVLYRELSIFYDSNTDKEKEIVDWKSFNIAMTAVFRNIIDHYKSSNPFDEIEKSAILRTMSGYSDFLIASGRFLVLEKSNITNSKDELRRKLRPPRMIPMTPSMKKYCAKYIQSIDFKKNIEELRNYLMSVEKTKPTSVEVKKLKESVAKQEVDSIKIENELKNELQKIKKSEPSFINEYCFDKGYWLNRPDPANETFSR